MARQSLIPITLLLKKDARSTQGIDQVEAQAAKLGLKPTGHGRASLSARVSLKTFKQLFGQEPFHQPARPTTDQDFGAPEGFRLDASLPVPAELADLIESISVEPPATRFTAAPPSS